MRRSTPGSVSRFCTEGCDQPGADLLPLRVELQLRGATIGLHCGDAGDQVFRPCEDSLPAGTVDAASTLKRHMVAQLIDLVVGQARRLEQRAQHDLVIRSHLTSWLVTVAISKPLDLKSGRVLPRDRAT